MAHRRNPAPSPAPTVTAKPGDPAPGDTYFHSGLGITIMWDGSAWQSLTAGVRIVGPGTGVLRKAVVVVDGAMVICDPSTHIHVSGVCAGIDDGLGLLRFGGSQGGYAGLTEGLLVYVDANGDPVHDPDDGETILPFGAATSATTIELAGEASGE